MKKLKKAKKYIIFAAIIISILIPAFYCGITVKTYNLHTNKLNNGSTICIVVIADLHNTVFGRDQQPLIKKIKQQNPDVILLAGDITEDYTPIDGTRLLLSGICGIAPIYYVEGNNEGTEYNDIQPIYDEMESFGVTVLADKYVQTEINGNKIIIAGVRDPYHPRYKDPYYIQSTAMEEAFSELDKTDGIYKILIAHRPERIESYAEYPFDLVVSGHTHGGQVRIPLIINGLYAPDQGWFPKYAGGFYEHDELVHIISRGLVVRTTKPRVFNPPEIVVINVKSD